jgi:hypothetical protein
MGAGDRSAHSSVGPAGAAIDASIGEWEGLPCGQAARIIDLPHGDACEPHGGAVTRRCGSEWAGGTAMNIPDELLAAYVDGQVQGAERARIEQAIARDARLAQRVAQYRASRSRLRGVFDNAVHEPISQRLLQSARSASRPTSAQVIDLARVRAERRRRNERNRLLQPHHIAIAACLVGGLLTGAVAERLINGNRMTEYQDGALVARGALADALDNQLADTPVPGNAFRVGMSFRTRSGNYCRTFSASDTHTLAGLACHEQEHWRIVTLVSTQPPVSVGPVASHSVAVSLSPLLLQTVRERMAGEPLDAQAESKARGSDWR